MQKPKLLITGATDGIGLELVKYYQSKGIEPLTLGRRPPDALPPELSAHHYCHADLAQPESIERTAQFIATHAPHGLDILIHNAAIGYYGPITGQTPSAIADMVHVNLRAPMAMTHALLPSLRTASKGQITFISSVASALPVADFAVYAATKAALDGFARSLRAELAPDITVQTIWPGAMRTQMHTKSGATQLDSSRFMPAKDAAARIARIVKSRAPEATLSPTDNAIRTSATLFEGLIARWLSRAAAGSHP